MSEIRVSGVPIPLVNYIDLIRSRRSPYYDIVQFLNTVTCDWVLKQFTRLTLGFCRKKLRR